MVVCVASVLILLVARPKVPPFGVMVYIAVSMAGNMPRTTLEPIVAEGVHGTITRGSRRLLLERTLFHARLAKTEEPRDAFEVGIVVENRVPTSL